MFRSMIIMMFLALSTSVSAQGFDYNYLELGYGRVDYDNINVDGDGLGIGGSFALNPDWHVFASYLAADLDFGVDARSFGAGIGYNTEMSPKVDAFARLSYQYVDFDSPFGGGDEDGLGFGVGLRFAATPEIEIDAGIDYVDLGDGGDDTSISLGGLYNFNDVFSLGLGGAWGDDASTYTLTGRLYFGR